MTTNKNKKVKKHFLFKFENGHVHTCCTVQKSIVVPDKMTALSTGSVG